MKKQILFFLTIIIVGTLSAQTTREEYNYITKGYKVQIESGLDMKKGYELKDVDKVQQNGTNGSIARQAFLKVLNRVSTNGTVTIAAYMIVYERAGSQIEYFCIPSPTSSQELINSYFSSLQPGLLQSSERLQLIAFLLSRSVKW